MNKPILKEVGDDLHYELVDFDSGKVLWSELDEKDNVESDNEE